MDFNLGLTDFPFDDLAEIKDWVIALDNSFLGCAEDGEVDLSSFSQDGEMGVDVFVDLGQELELYFVGDAWGDLTFRSVCNFEVVLGIAYSVL